MSSGACWAIKRGSEACQIEATKAGLVSATHMRTASEIRGNFQAPVWAWTAAKNHGEFLKDK